MKLLNTLMALFFFFLPFQFALNILDGFDIAIVRICVLLIFIVFLIISFWKKDLFVARGWISGLLFFFCTWTLLSLMISPALPWTLRKIIFIFSFLPIFYVLTAIFVKISHARTIVIRAWVYGACAVAIVGIIQFFIQFFISLQKIIVIWSTISPYFFGQSFSASILTYNSWLVHVGSIDVMRAIAFFPDPHIYSFYCGLTIPFAFALYLTLKQKRWLICGSVIFLVDLLTFSRGGYVGLIGGFILFLLLSWHVIPSKFRNAIYIGSFFLLFFFVIPQNMITQRFLSSFDPTDNSNTHRIELWTTAMENIVQRPFFGTGLGAYSYTIDPSATYRTPIYVHNLILDITVELGAIGGLIICALFFRVFYVFFINRRDTFAFFGIISLCIFLLHAIFDTPLFSVHIFPILLLLFALAAYYENVPKNNR